MTINISPSALKAWLACKRRWYLEHVVKADRVVPSYVTAGTTLDLVVQDYLKGKPLQLAAGSPELAELNALLPELPAPTSVLVQERFRLSCPGFEGRVQITTGGLDYMTPPNLDLMIIGDLKRIWHKDAAMSPEALAEDVQAQMYAWLVWQTYNPAEIIFRWTYCVRETRNQTTGAVTRKAKAFSVDVKADRRAVEAWFDGVVLQAAKQMLQVIGPAEAVEHDPTSCEEGARCFVRHHCPMYSGPVIGESAMVDLSKFKTNKSSPVPTLAQACEEQRARIAINPPALAPVPVAEAADFDLQAASPMADLLSVATIEGPGAALLETVGEEAPETLPAPPPAASEPEGPKAPRRRRNPSKATAALSTCGVSAVAPIGNADALEKQGLSAHEAEAIGAPPSVESATTEALVWELRDRGYEVYLHSGAL